MTQGTSPQTKWAGRARRTRRRQRRHESTLGGRPLAAGERRQIRGEATGDSSRGKLRQSRRTAGRCGLPCGRHDSQVRNDPFPLDHRCVRHWGHPGPCDFIGTCARDLRKTGVTVFEPAPQPPEVPT